MPFVIEAHLLDGAYQAATVGRDGAEWPPHPARLFCALVAVADPDDPVQDAALGWLERQPSPAVCVPAGSTEARPRVAWVPTNATVPSKKEPSHGVLPGRTSGGQLKTWPQRSVERPEFSFVWEAEPPGGVRAVLEALARRVPYLGRASAQVLLAARVTAADEADDAVWQVWEPATAVPDGAVREAGTLRVPYAGYLRRLREAFAAGQPAWEQARSARYVRRSIAEETEASAEVLPGPFRDLVTFAFDRGVSVAPAATMALTGALRSTIMGMLKDYGHDVRAIPSVHGHADSSEARSCAFLGLPFVGHPHADGRLRGVAVALPHGLDAAHRRALLAVLVNARSGLKTVAAPGTPRPVAVTYVGPSEVAGVTVRPETWTQPSRVWRTALPMVLDRFPGRNGKGIEKSVAVSCRLAGLPEPEEIVVLRHGSLVPGAPDLPASALRRKPGEPPLPSRHVQLRFARPLAGPVVIGSKRNFGLGLCLPDRRNKEETA